MPIKTTLWMVGEEPQMLKESQLAKERQLEDMIVQKPELLSDEWMLIGRQVHTGHGGKIDLLALAPDGSLVLIELKRSKTSREVIAQALDYATWVENLQSEDLAEIYGRFSSDGNLAQDFNEKFGQNLDEDQLNQTHQIIIVAAELDSSTERIVKYLNDHGIAVNVLFFQVFDNASDQQLLSRTWLLDPVETQLAASTTRKRDSEPWNGEFYCSFGEGEARSWREAIDHGFICGGGGTWYSGTLKLLSPGDRVWVYIPRSGFVGVGRVLERAQPASEFRLATENGEKPALDVLTEATYQRDSADDRALCEYFVRIDWLDTKPIEEAVQAGPGYRHTVCRPTTRKWRSTIERLKAHFPKFDAPSS